MYELIIMSTKISINRWQPRFIISTGGSLYKANTEQMTPKDGCLQNTMVKFALYYKASITITI